MAAELAAMYVSIVPTFRGGAKAIESQMGPSIKSAGVKAGKDFAAGFSAQEISAAQVKKFTSEVAAASAKVAAARQKEADAAGALRVAEAKLDEARAKALPGSSQLLAAEERAAAASRRLASAQSAAKAPVDALARAQQGLKAATEDAGKSGTTAGTTYAKGWAGIKARLGDSIKGAVKSGMDGAEGTAQAGGKRAGGAFTEAFKGGVAALGVGLSIGAATDFLGSAVNGAGKLEQSVGAIESVFKDSSGQMKAWSQNAATDVGLTQNEFNELGTLIGAQLKNGGTAMDQLAPKTHELIGLGADLSSMFGGSASDAVQALSSALKGERDPIEKYGVSLTQAKIDAEAAALGFEKVGGALSSEATQAATMSLIMKQTGDAHGNFAKESDTFAQKQQVMSAKWEDLKTKIGEQFMPALSGAFSFIADTAIPAAGRFGDGLANVGQWVKDNAAWLVPLTAAVTGYVVAVGTMSILATARGWLAAAQAAQWGLNAAMSANPIGIVIGVLAGLVAGLVWFFTQTELGQRIWKNVWDGISAAIGWTWNYVIKPVFEALSDFITKTIPKAFEDGIGFIKSIWEGLQEIAKAPIRFVINTVLNDGLIGAFNTVAGFLGAKKLDRISIPGFADGGYTGNGGKYQPAGIVHAGEVVWSQADVARWGGPGVVDAMRKASGYAGGGIVNPLKQMALTQGYNRVHKGVDLAAGVGTPVFASEDGRVSWAGPGATAPGVWGGNEVHINGSSGVQTWYAHLSRIMVGLGDMVRGGQQIALSGNTGISSGPHLHFGAFSGGWPNDINPLSYLGGAGIPSGGVGGGFNPITGVIDMLMGKFKEAFPAGGALIDLVGAVGKKILSSAADFITGLFSNSSDGSATGIRPTLYDGGGWLENTGGAQLIQHNKAKPDAVLSNAQWETMSRIAENSAGGATVQNNIQINGRTLFTAMTQLQTQYGGR